MPFPSINFYTQKLNKRVNLIDSLCIKHVVKVIKTWDPIINKRYTYKYINKLINFLNNILGYPLILSVY